MPKMCTLVACAPTRRPPRPESVQGDGQRGAGGAGHHAAALRCAAAWHSPLRTRRPAESSRAPNARAGRPASRRWARRHCPQTRPCRSARGAWVGVRCMGGRQCATGATAPVQAHARAARPTGRQERETRSGEAATWEERSGAAPNRTACLVCGQVVALLAQIHDHDQAGKQGGVCGAQGHTSCAACSRQSADGSTAARRPQAGERGLHADRAAYIWRVAGATAGAGWRWLAQQWLPSPAAAPVG